MATLILLSDVNGLYNKNPKLYKDATLINKVPEINSKIELTLNKRQEKEINTAISNTFGFGGHNASILFKKYIEQPL